MVYAPTVGDYVSWKDSEAKVQYGRVKDASSGAIVIKRYDDDSDTSPASVASYVDLGKSNWGRMKMRMKPNAWEVAENVAVAAIYHPLVARNKIMDAEFYAFCLADLTHEFVTKGFTEQMADMLLPATVTGDDATGFFSTSDFSDALRKAPFVVALQQIYQRALFRKSWGHQLMSNSFGNFSILAVSNVVDRMWSAKDSGYTYP